MENNSYNQLVIYHEISHVKKKHFHYQMVFTMGKSIYPCYNYITIDILYIYIHLSIYPYMDHFSTCPFVHMVTNNLINNCRYVVTSAQVQPILTLQSCALKKVCSNQWHYVMSLKKHGNQWHDHWFPPYINLSIYKWLYIND